MRSDASLWDAFWGISLGHAGQTHLAPFLGSQAPTAYPARAIFIIGEIITDTAQTSSGLNEETFVLTAALSGGRVDWAASGTCKTRTGGVLC